MPYCTQCGNQVTDSDVFCAKCGSRQGLPGNAAPGSSRAGRAGRKPLDFNEALGGISPRVASLLCYIPVIGWIASIVVLAAERFRRDRTVRFHAFQGLYLFVAWLIVENAVGPALHWSIPFGDGRHGIEGMLKLALIGVWIFMMVKTSHEELFRLPILGELAERSVSEQR